MGLQFCLRMVNFFIQMTFLLFFKCDKGILGMVASRSGLWTSYGSSGVNDQGLVYGQYMCEFGG